VDAPLAQVPVRLWPSVRLAPPWAEVADRVLLALDGRTLVVHDQARLDVLRRHLPDWQPAEVVFTRALAERWRPRLVAGGPGPRTAPAATGDRRSRLGPGAVAEAHAVAVLLATLHTTGQPIPQPLLLTGTGLPVRPARQAVAAAGRPGGLIRVPGRRLPA